MTNVLQRFDEAISSGKMARRRLTPAGLGKISAAQQWPEAMRIVLQVSDVHSDAQRQFLDTWMRVGFAYIRNKVADDDLFFAALRRLLPTYDGPPRTLFRGQRVSHPIGMSWTRSFNIAEAFAIYGTAAPREQGEPREDGVLLMAQVHNKQIICAPCLLGEEEGEYIIDPRDIDAKSLIKYGEVAELLRQAQLALAEGRPFQVTGRPSDFISPSG
jgi:hypothetical protein